MITQTTLKNAARAIGHDLWTDPATKANYLAKDGAILRRWEPETSSADSFELMARLGLDVQMFRGMMIIVAEDFSGDFQAEWEWNNAEDRAHGYRMAILLCAAKVGESL